MYLSNASVTVEGHEKYETYKNAIDGNRATPLIASGGKVEFTFDNEYNLVNVKLLQIYLTGWNTIYKPPANGEQPQKRDTMTPGNLQNPPNSDAIAPGNLQYPPIIVMQKHLTIFRIPR